MVSAGDTFTRQQGRYTVVVPLAPNVATLQAVHILPAHVCYGRHSVDIPSARGRALGSVRIGNHSASGHKADAVILAPLPSEAGEAEGRACRHLHIVVCGHAVTTGLVRVSPERAAVHLRVHAR